MFKVPSRASLGNKTYAQKPFKSLDPTRRDNRSCYQVVCPTCKAKVGDHCTLISGADVGFWSMPHRKRATLFLAGQGTFEPESTEYLTVDCPTCNSLKEEPCISQEGTEIAVHLTRIKEFHKYA